MSEDHEATAIGTGLVNDYDSSSSETEASSSSSEETTRESIADATTNDANSANNNDLNKPTPAANEGHSEIKPAAPVVSSSSSSSSDDEERKRKRSSSSSSSSSSRRRKSRSRKTRHSRSRSRSRHGRRSSRRHRRSRSTSRRRHRRRSRSSRRRRSRSSSRRRYSRRTARSSRRQDSRRRESDRHRRSRSRRRSSSREGSRNKRTFKDDIRDKFVAQNTAAVNAAIASMNQAPAGSNSAVQPLLSNPMSTSVAMAAAMALNLRQQGHKLTEAELMARIQAQQEQKMREVIAQAEAVTGVKLPKYYNPAAINPLKMAEQEQKKKLLWSGKKNNTEEESAKKALWTRGSLVATGGDVQAAQKFRQLMGIGSEETGQVQAGEVLKSSAGGMVDPNEWHKRLEQEYESARVQTHTQKGSGLGYNQQAYIDPNLYSGDKSAANPKL